MSLRIKSPTDLPAGPLRDQVALAFRSQTTTPREQATRPRRGVNTNTDPGDSGTVGADSVATLRKYRNEPIIENGHKFDSKLEAKRYVHLLELESSDLITDLRVHTSFALHVLTPGQRLERNTIGGTYEVIGTWTDDFDYMRAGQWVVEDCKSSATRRLGLYRWKVAHFEVEYGVKVVEIVRARKRKREEI